MRVQGQTVLVPDSRGGFFQEQTKELRFEFLIGYSMEVRDFWVALIQFLSTLMCHRSNMFQDSPVWKVSMDSVLGGTNLVPRSLLP